MTNRTRQPVRPNTVQGVNGDGRASRVMGLGRVVNSAGENAQPREGGEDVVCMPCGSDVAQRPHVWRVPVQPTDRERELHEATHLPFQPWCEFCIQGKSPNRKHLSDQRDAEEKEEAIPTVAMDYMFLSAQDQDKMSPVLVTRDTKSKTLFAHAVSRKGASDQWIVKRLTEDLDSLGCGRIANTIRRVPRTSYS